MGRVYDLIKDGDMRMAGGSGAAAALVRAKPALAAELLDLLNHANPAVRMRAADALEKASSGNEALLAPHKALLLELAETTAQKELRWHLAQLLPRLELNGEEVLDAAELMQRWYARDASRIVRTFALQGLADLAARDGQLIGAGRELADHAAASGVPALVARARKVKAALARLEER